MVMHEDQNQPKFHNFNIGCRSSKKNKSKKIPQRGLGVEKLEKLRIEEQQKTNIDSTSSSPSSQTENFYKLGAIYSLGRGPSPTNAEEVKHLSPIWLVNKTATEPPSNQNYCFSNYDFHFSSQADERKNVIKMSGTDLRLPFLRDESMKFEYKGIGLGKESESSSNSHQLAWRNSVVLTSKRLRENEASPEREFLTLGLQSQGRINHDVEESENPSEKILYTFWPIDRTTCERDEAMDDVDTRLKL